MRCLVGDHEDGIHKHPCKLGGLREVTRVECNGAAGAMAGNRRRIRAARDDPPAGATCGEGAFLEFPVFSALLKLLELLGTGLGLCLAVLNLRLCTLIHLQSISTQPKRIGKVDGIPIRVRIQIEPPGQADRILLGITPD